MINAFKRGIVGTYSSSDTVIELTDVTGLVAPLNLVIYDGLFGNPADANNAGSYEIVRVTSVNSGTDEITVLRAQEGTSAVTIGAGSWQAIFSATVKTFTDIQDEIDSIAIEWGNIDGTLSDQTDLQSALDGKEPADATILKEADIVDNLTEGGVGKPLSAEQGKVLNDNKQQNLISGTNIKTINSESILGSGNLDVGGGKVLQVKYAENSTQKGGGTGSYVDTDLSIAITPESSTSTIYIFADHQISLQSATGDWRVLRDATQIGQVAYADIVGSGTFEEFTLSMKRRDVHGSSVEITYKTQMRRRSGTAITINRETGDVPTQSTLMVVEVE
jgi:hypothetical protein